MELGHEVVGFDNLVRGTVGNLNGLLGRNAFAFEEIDLADADATRDAFLNYHRRSKVSEVWHMAANSDIPAGIADATVDLRHTFLTTFNLLTAMKEAQVPFLAFASSSAVYGDLGDIAIDENSGPLLPISNYGAMKLASEGAISAAVESWLDRAIL